MHRVARLLVALFVASVPLLVWGVEPAGACSCASGREPRHLAEADAVFVGTATAVDAPQPGPGWSSIDPVTWTFTVESVVKGDVGVEQQVTTAASSASCGLDLSVGQAYLVFASADAAPTGAGPLQAGLCGGTRPAVPGEQPAGLPAGRTPAGPSTDSAAPADTEAPEGGGAMPWLVATAAAAVALSAAAGVVAHRTRVGSRPAG